MAKEKKIKKEKEVVETTIQENKNEIVEAVAEQELPQSPEPEEEKKEEITVEEKQDMSALNVESKEELSQKLEENIAKVNEKKDSTKKEMKEVLQVTPSEELSPNAKKWQAYLNMTKMTPEVFLTKYPNHPSRMYVKEIIEKRK